MDVNYFSPWYRIQKHLSRTTKDLTVKRERGLVVESEESFLWFEAGTKESGTRN